MLAAVSRLRAVNRTFGLSSVSLLSAMEKNSIAVTPEQKAYILGGLRSLYGDCVVVPSTGGAATDQLFSMRRAMGRTAQP